MESAKTQHGSRGQVTRDVTQQCSRAKATRNYALAEELSLRVHRPWDLSRRPCVPTLAALGLGGSPSGQAVVPPREMGRAHPW